MNNLKEIQDKYAEIMGLLGIKEDVNSVKTPYRVAKMLMEVFENVNKDPKIDLLPQISLFPSTYSGDVKITDIEVVSFCSHHHMPFMGVAELTYLPNKHIIGLSKVPRVVNWFCRKPHLQEELTREIGEFLVGILEPNSLEFKISECLHTCMRCRGVRSDGRTTTIYQY